MTNGYGCALGDESHQVNWLITRLRPAMTISLCDDDFPVGLIPVLGSELGVDPGRLYETIKRFVDREQAREAKITTAGPTEVDKLDPTPEPSYPVPCESCGRVSGMPSAPCQDCPDYDQADDS